MSHNKINLSVYHRIMMNELKPSQGSIVEAIDWKSIEDKIKISAEEAKKINLRNNAGNLEWNPQKADIISVEFTNREIKTFLSSCELASSNGAFPQDGKFVDFYLMLREISKENV